MGDNGTILTSDNGIDWITRTASVTDHLFGITYGEGTFVAVGDNGTILTSDNGANWTERYPDTSHMLNGVTYGCGTFIAVGEQGTIVRSVLSLQSPVSIITSLLPSGSVGFAYNQTLTVSCGQLPYAWAVLSGNLPPGLSLNPSTGSISGTPTSAGTSNFTIQVTDSATPSPNTSTKAFSITIVAAPPQLPLAVTKSGTGTGTVTSVPLGIDCGAACSADYTVGTTVTLSTNPASGSLFTGWSGDTCTGTGPCAVTMNAGITATAAFDAQPQYTLSVSKTGTGSGTVTSVPAGITCDPTCTANYTAGTPVTLTATANPGSVFSGWSGGGCTGTGVCSISVNGPTTVTATFDPTPPGAFSYTKCLSGNTTATGANIASAQTDFPVAVHICPNCPSPNFNATEKAHFFGSWNVSGKRVQLLASDQTTILPYEVEYYNAIPGSEEAVYWVKVPTVTGNNANSNMVCVAYGNDPNGSDQDNKSGVWDSNFKGVWHLGDNSRSNPTQYDSIVGNHNGTEYNSPAVADGRIRKGIDFNGTNHYIGVPSSSDWDYTGSNVGTITFWMKPDALSGSKSVFAIGDTDPNANFIVYPNNADTSKICIGKWGTGAVCSTTGAWITSSWQHIAIIKAASSMKAYVNDTEKINTGSNYFTTGDLLFGMTGTNWIYDGIIDEIRVSNTNRSTDWIKLEYSSMKKTNWNGDSWITWNSEMP